MQALSSEGVMAEGMPTSTEEHAQSMGASLVMRPEHANAEENGGHTAAPSLDVHTEHVDGVQADEHTVSTSSAMQKEQTNALEGEEQATTSSLEMRSEYTGALPTEEQSFSKVSSPNMSSEHLGELQTEQQATVSTHDAHEEPAIKLEPGEILSSPAQAAAVLKRPLSLTAATSSSQDAKRARTDASSEKCLHCGSPSHRWTACMSKCSHCGQRHLGARCGILPPKTYTPSGFRPNKHYRPLGEDLPALPLTPVDAAVPEYTTVPIDQNFDSSTEGMRLYVGNIAYATTESELKEFFKDFYIEALTIPANPRTDRPCGYAFVTVSTPVEAERAVSQLSGKKILDRKVAVQVARQYEPVDAKPTKVGHGEAGVGGAAGDAAIPAAPEHSNAPAGKIWTAAATTSFECRPVNGMIHASAADAMLGAALRQSVDTHSSLLLQPNGLPNVSTASVGRNSRLSFDESPATSMDDKMDADRAALIAITDDSNAQKIKPVGEAPCLGPKITGMNKVPLGERKPRGPDPPAHVKDGQQASGLTWQDVSILTVHAANPAADTPARPVRPARRGKKPSHAHSKTAGTHNTVRGSVSQPKPKSSLFSAPMVPAYGQSLFCSGNSAGADYTPSPYAVAQMKAIARTRAEAARNLVKDTRVWQELEQHIVQAIHETSRVGKPFNSKIRLNVKVKEAIDILKPIVLGAQQAPSGIDLDAGQPGAAPASAVVSTGGAPGITAAAAGMTGAAGMKAGAAGMKAGAAGMSAGAAGKNAGAAGMKVGTTGMSAGAAGMTAGAASMAVSLPGSLAQLQPPRLEWNEAAGAWQWVIPQW